MQAAKSSFDRLRSDDSASAPPAPEAVFAASLGVAVVARVAESALFPSFDLAGEDTGATSKGASQAAAVGREPDLEPVSPEAADAEQQVRARAVELEQAHERGVAEGRAAAAADLASVASGIETVVAELGRFRSGLAERYQRELLDVAFAVARKIVHGEIAGNQELWLSMLRDGVQRTVDRERLCIRVGPALHRFLVAQLPRLAALLDDVKDIDLVEDASLGDSGCLIESRYGDLDLGIDRQLEALRDAVGGGR